MHSANRFSMGYDLLALLSHKISSVSNDRGVTAIARGFSWEIPTMWGFSSYVCWILLVYKPHEYSYKFYLRIRNHSEIGVICTHQLSELSKTIPWQRGSAALFSCSVQVGDRRINKPFVEKPVDRRDRDIYAPRSTVGILPKGWWWFFFGWNLWCSHWVNFHAGHFGSFIDWPVKVKLFKKPNWVANDAYQSLPAAQLCQLTTSGTSHPKLPTSSKHYVYIDINGFVSIKFWDLDEVWRHMKTIGNAI